MLWSTPVGLPQKNRRPRMSAGMGRGIQADGRYAIYPSLVKAATRSVIRSNGVSLTLSHTCHFIPFVASCS